MGKFVQAFLLESALKASGQHMDASRIFQRLTMLESRSMAPRKLVPFGIGVSPGAGTECRYAATDALTSRAVHNLLACLKRKKLQGQHTSTEDFEGANFGLALGRQLLGNLEDKTYVEAVWIFFNMTSEANEGGVSRAMEMCERIAICDRLAVSLHGQCARPQSLLRCQLHCP